MKVMLLCGASHDLVDATPADLEGEVTAGTVAAVDGLELDHWAFELIGAYLRFNPYFPLVWICRDESQAAIVRAFSNCARLHLHVTDAPATAALVRTVLSARDTPTTRDIASSAAFTLGSRAYQPVLDALNHAQKPYTLCRRLSDLQLPTPHYWDELLQSIRLLTVARKQNLDEQRAANEFGVSVKTASNWCRTLYRRNWGRVKALNCWEAMLFVAWDNLQLVSGQQRARNGADK